MFIAEIEPACFPIVASPQPGSIVVNFFPGSVILCMSCVVCSLLLGKFTYGLEIMN